MVNEQQADESVSVGINMMAAAGAASQGADIPWVKKLFEAVAIGAMVGTIGSAIYRVWQWWKRMPTREILSDSLELSNYSTFQRSLVDAQFSALERLSEQERENRLVAILEIARVPPGDLAPAPNAE